MNKVNKKRTALVQTKYGTHTIMLEPDEEKGYIASSPNLDGVITWGKNIAHAKAMVQEAIEVCIEALVMKNKPRVRYSQPSRVAARELMSVGA